MPIIAELKQIDGEIWARVMQPVGEGSVCLWTDEEVRAHDMRVLASVDIAPQGTFEWALLHMKAGKKVTRPEMLEDCDGWYIWLDGENFWQGWDTGESEPHGGRFHASDLLATDWSLYEGEKA